jgi:phosphoribosylformylglycinamidine (FGAM) synthase PurS component
MEFNDWETGSVSRRLAVESSFNRKRQIDVLINLETRMAELKERVEQELKPMTAEQFYDMLRNTVIEEVAVEIEKMTGFGADTVDSLTVYIRGMKNDKSTAGI